MCQGFALRHLLGALEAGDRTRIVVGLCAYFIIVDLSYSSILGGKAQSLQQAEALLRETEDPRCQAWVAFARGFAFLHDGLLKPASLDLARAEALLSGRCTDVGPELSVCRILYARTLALLGQTDELDVCEGWIREAAECEDSFAVAKLRMLLVPRALVHDDVEQVRAALRLPPELPNAPLGLIRVLHLSSRLHLALYVDDREEQRRVAEEMAAVARSPLFAVRIWRSDYLIRCARAHLAASRGAAEPEAVLGRAEDAIARIEKLALDCHADHAHLLRAALEHRRGRDPEALASLDAILAEADMGGESSLVRACARLCKGRLLGGDTGEALARDAEAELESAGAKDPLRLARIYAPGFEEGEGGGEAALDSR